MPGRSATGAANGEAARFCPRPVQGLGHALASLHLAAHPDFVADRVAELAKNDSVIAHFIDYRTAGPGTLPDVFRKAEVIVCTENSSTMVSEAVSARLPWLAWRRTLISSPTRNPPTADSRAQQLVPRAADRVADP